MSVTLALLSGTATLTEGPGFPTRPSLSSLGPQPSDLTQPQLPSRSGRCSGHCHGGEFPGSTGWRPPPSTPGRDFPMALLWQLQGSEARRHLSGLAAGYQHHPSLSWPPAPTDLHRQEDRNRRRGWSGSSPRCSWESLRASEVLGRCKCEEPWAGVVKPKKRMYFLPVPPDACVPRVRSGSSGEPCLGRHSIARSLAPPPPSLLHLGLSGVRP